MNDHDEWAADVADMSENDRYINLNAHRWALGITGDKEDDQC